MNRSAMLVAPLAILALALGGCSTASSDADDPLIVQFVPTRTEEDMQAQALPLAELLSEQLGRDVEVSIATDYSTIVEAMAAGQVDVGIMPPASYVLAHEQGAADAVLQAQIPATDPETALPIPGELVDSFRGEILVAADSGIDSIDDLAGRSIAVQNAASASGYIFPLVEMSDAGIDTGELTLTTVAGIDSAILAVLNGDVDAAFSFEGGRVLLRDEFPDITERVSVVYTTTARIPNDTIAVSRSVDDGERQAIQDAFLAISEDEEGLEIISTLYSHQGYVPADQSAYDIVRDFTERASRL